MRHEPFLNANETVIVKGHNEFDLAPCFERGKRVYYPVVGVNDVRTLLGDDAV
jgi:hypothetical protein